MRALWLTAEPPDRAMGGGSIRQAYLLEALAERFQTTCVVVGGRVSDTRTTRALLALVELDSPAHSRSRWAMRAVELHGALRRRRPPEVRDNAAARRRLSEVLERLPPQDVVLVEHAGLAPLVARRTSGRWILTLHNVASESLRQQALLSPTSRQRLLLSRQSRQARALESWAIRKFDKVFAVSDEDARLLPGAVSVIPNGVDARLYEPTPVTADASLVFVGTLGFLPNVDGIQWFVREVLPNVRERVPGVTLRLVGRTPTVDVEALHEVPGVTVHPDVQDVRPYLRDSRISIVPLRHGTGTRLKLLESLAAGRPVVTTTVGAAGLGVEHGKQALIADDADSFADSVVRLLTETESAQALADRGRAWVTRRYAWSNITDKFIAEVASASGGSLLAN